MINLPDILPSAIYFNDSATASMMRSSGESIPNIIGEILYDCIAYSDRFDGECFVMPVLYSMAPKIAKAQQLANRDGNTLIIYETFRPYALERMPTSPDRYLQKPMQDSPNSIAQDFHPER